MDSRHVASESDQGLVKTFLGTGDQASFRKLYRRHTPALYGLALRLTGGSEAAAQDAVQDTWIRACKTLGGFEWRSSLRTWLMGILINRLRELNRDCQRRSEEELSNQCSLSTTAGQTGERVDLEQAIARLPAGYRQVLVLHDAEGYTHDEISALLEVSVGTSKSQLHHARRTIRAMLRPEYQSNE